MANINQAFGTTTSITITLASLANSGAATSSAIDNSTNLYLDALVDIVVNVAATPTATGAVEIYTLASVDGTNFEDVANAKQIGVLSTVTTGSYRGVFSVAAAYGGSLPVQWKLYVKNIAGSAFASTGNSAQYRGVYATSV